jgi:ParB family chromosome partitioning protein
MFDEDGMQELASIREHDLLQPLLARPRTERRFEILFGAQCCRGTAMAERETVPVCIREMTDAQVLEAQLVKLSLVDKSFHCLHAAPYVAYM